MCVRVYVSECMCLVCVCVCMLECVCMLVCVFMCVSIHHHLRVSVLRVLYKALLYFVCVLLSCRNTIDQETDWLTAWCLWLTGRLTAWCLWLTDRMTTWCLWLTGQLTAWCLWLTGRLTDETTERATVHPIGRPAGPLIKWLDRSPDRSSRANDIKLFIHWQIA